MRTRGRGALAYVDGVHATPDFPTDISGPECRLLRVLHLRVRPPRRLRRPLPNPALAGAAAPAEAGAVVRRRAVAVSNEAPPPIEQLAGVSAAVEWIAGLTDASEAAVSACSRRLAANRGTSARPLTRIYEWAPAIRGHVALLHRGDDVDRCRSWRTLYSGTDAARGSRPPASGRGTAITMPSS